MKFHEKATSRLDGLYDEGKRTNHAMISRTDHAGSFGTSTLVETGSQGYLWTFPSVFGQSCGLQQDAAKSDEPIRSLVKQISLRDHKCKTSCSTAAGRILCGPLDRWRPVRAKELFSAVS